MLLSRAGHLVKEWSRSHKNSTWDKGQRYKGSIKKPAKDIKAASRSTSNLGRVMSASAALLAGRPLACRRGERRIERIPVGGPPDPAEDVGVSQGPGRAGQGVQRYALGVGWKKHQGDKVDRLAIDRIKGDRVLETGEHSNRLLHRAQPRVREGNAVPHARGPEPLPLQNGVENLFGAQVQLRGHVVGECPKQRAFVGCPQAQDDIARG